MSKAIPFEEREGHMTYEEAAECDDLISPNRARHEIEAHSADYNEFCDEVGDKDDYTICEVLRWLGY
jgi:hypothetical protein